MSDEVMDTLAPELTEEESASMQEPPEEVTETPVEETKELVPDELKLTVEEIRGEEPKEEPVEEEKPPQDYVPQQALHEARAENREIRDKLVRMEETFQRLVGEQKQSQQAPAEELPSLDDDPIGYLEAQVRDLHQFKQEVQQREQQTQQQTQIEQQQNQMLDTYTAATQEYTKTVEDYPQAYEFLKRVVDKDLEARGIDDPTDRENRMLYEEGLMVGRAMVAGKNPAELLYNYAKTRGYGGPTAPEEEPTQLDRIEAGQAAAQSLNASGGSADVEGGRMTLARLSRLMDEDPEEGDRQWEKMRRAGQLG